MDIQSLNEIPPWEWPSDTGQMLLKVLRDGRADASERLLATELAGDCTVINDEIARELLSIALSDNEPESLRATAAISLGPALEDANCYDYDDPDEVAISEALFNRIMESLGKLYMDTGVPDEVRRKVLEATVRAPRDWHREAVLAAYSSKDEEWKLTAVYCMRFVRGFDKQILESLNSKNVDIHYEAVVASGDWEVDAAWPHIAALLTSRKTKKPLLLAAIEAAPYIRPEEAGEILVKLTDSHDEDISDAAFEAMSLAEALSDDKYEKYDVDEYDEDDDENNGSFN